MATIKSFTDIPQSNKLAEFLPIESADMYYDGFGRLPQGYAYILISPNSFEYDKPCWSLAALLDVLPEYHLSSPNPLGSIYCCRVNDIETYADNPVDACVEMIIKLNELNLL